MEKIYADLVVARNTVTVDGHNATLRMTEGDSFVDLIVSTTEYAEDEGDGETIESRTAYIPLGRDDVITLMVALAGVLHDGSL